MHEFKLKPWFSFTTILCISLNINININTNKYIYILNKYLNINILEFFYFSLLVD